MMCSSKLELTDNESGFVLAIDVSSTWTPKALGFTPKSDVNP